MKLVENEEQLIENTKIFDSYSTSVNIEENDFYKDRLKLGKMFLHIRASNRNIFCPSRFVGYENNSMKKHLAFEAKTGTKTNKKINDILTQNKSNDKSEEDFIIICNKFEIEPANKKRKYWIIDCDGNFEEKAHAHNTESNYPDELNGYTEGHSKRVLVNRYERDKNARTECIQHYGCECIVCGLNFEKIYGDIGKNFIHVHHLTRISIMGEKYIVNPIKDLRPVCPNCHSMLHKSDPPFSIEELKLLINENGPNK